MAALLQAVAAGVLSNSNRSSLNSSNSSGSSSYLGASTAFARSFIRSAIYRDLGEVQAETLVLVGDTDGRYIATPSMPPITRRRSHLLPSDSFLLQFLLRAVRFLPIDVAAAAPSW